MENQKYHLSTIILAAGKGTRMKSDLAKVLHPLCGRPLLTYSIDLARSIGSEKKVVIIGHQADLVREFIKDTDIIFVEQRELLGTGHAVLQARDIFLGYKGMILILCGDVPLLSLSAVKSLVNHHLEEKSAITVLTTILDNPTGYGRVVKRTNGIINKIVEEKDAGAEEKNIREINTGIYCVNSEVLFDAVAQINNVNAQSEYYLTDIIEISYKKSLKVRSFIASDPVEVMGINTPEDLEKAAKYKEASGFHPFQ